jgi:NADH dehydrogenase [ubiquinone] 1 alpha subcomplex assembly factor 1
MCNLILAVFVLVTVSVQADEQRALPAPDPVTLFDFRTQVHGDWQVLNDGVMGGRSKGYVEHQDGRLRFSGTTVTEGGGFTSIRARVILDLQKYEGLEIRVRGGGRSFEIELEDGVRTRGRRISRRASFDTDDGWKVIRVPFSSLQASTFGRPVSAPPVDLSNVTQIGIYIVDGNDGPFSLEVETIRAYGAVDE